MAGNCHGFIHTSIHNSNQSKLFICEYTNQINQKMSITNDENKILLGDPIVILKTLGDPELNCISKSANENTIKNKRILTAKQFRNTNYQPQ